MRMFVGVTDGDWFRQLSSIPDIDEVNFWQPSGEVEFKALQPAEAFLFKLHSPRNFIVGGGFFAHWSALPVALAWEAFGDKNGAADFAGMRDRIEKLRRGTGAAPRAGDPRSAARAGDYTIGCIMISQPVIVLFK